MASNNKCLNCGSLDLDCDPARGDVICTNCGTVLEHSAIVSEVQFEENAHGGSSALGQFVSSDSKGGSHGFGGCKLITLLQNNIYQSFVILFLCWFE